MLLVKRSVSPIGYMSWIASVASGQTICLHALESTHRSYPVDAEEKHDEKAA